MFFTKVLVLSKFHTVHVSAASHDLWEFQRLQGDGHMYKDYFWHC